MMITIAIYCLLAAFLFWYLETDDRLNSHHAHNLEYANPPPLPEEIKSKYIIDDQNYHF